MGWRRGQAYGQDLRDRVMAASGSLREVVIRFSVSESYVAQARHAWAAERPHLDTRRLVFLDETWASTHMTPRRGRSPRGQRCLGYVPYGHWKTTTFLCALRTQGLVAPLVLDGPINGRAFRAWVEQALAPTLGDGDIVVMDNLSSHKVAGVRGAELRYLPLTAPITTRSSRSLRS